MNYFLPTSAAEAVTLADRHPGSRYFAGGTDLQILMKQGLEMANTIIDLSRIDDLRRIHGQPGDWQIGALVSLSELADHPAIREQFPILRQAARSIGSPVLRKTATVGGNLLVANRCTFYNQSADWRLSIGSCLRDAGEICQVTGVSGNCYSRNVSDLAPVFMALGAEIAVTGPAGSRSLPLAEIYVPDGIHYLQSLRPGELLTRIRISGQGGRTWYRKLRMRRAVDFSSLTMAAVLRPDGLFRVCVNAVSMAPVFLEGRLKAMTWSEVRSFFRKNCKTVNNDLLPLSYRRAMLFRWLEEWWDTLRSAGV